MSGLKFQKISIRAKFQSAFEHMRRSNGAGYGPND
jgi:hypothetical protein